MLVGTEAPPLDPFGTSSARLQQSRRDIVQLITALRGDGCGVADEFPRSRLMRLAFGRHGRAVVGGAALGLVVLRPGLLPLFGRWIPWAPLVPVLRAVLKRYLVRRKEIQ